MSELLSSSLIGGRLIFVANFRDYVADHKPIATR
jgi:hypothetical protein